jgi:hypothetical protein
MSELPKLDQAAFEARNKLIKLFSSLLLLDLAMTLIDQDYRGLIRLMFTILLMYVVLQGHRWAKWIVVIFASLGIPIGLLAAVGYETVIGKVLSLTLFLLDFLLVIHLIKSRPLDRYFDYKRKLNSIRV